ncbi:MAG: DUF485 domain-containing protein [Planctomycetaceae bacterium]|nr:DUF485 domain-containing protein [Planctomycetaceae bacterium]
MTRNARIGLVLFVIYLLLYGGFVGLNTFFPQTMEVTPIAGINLAILYGFGLIAAALAMALLYGVLCTPEGDLPVDRSKHVRQPKGNA